MAPLRYQLGLFCCVFSTVALSDPSTLIDRADQNVARALGWAGHIENLLAGSRVFYDTAEVFQGRLTTESGVPVSTSDRVAQSTLYFTPYQGAKVRLYDGTAWNTFSFNEISLTLSGLTASRNYDVFIYDNSGSPALELSTVWTSDTARAQAVNMFEGIYTLQTNRTRRYVGTIRATGATTTEDSATRRFVWNVSNRVPRFLVVTETTNTWSYTTNTLRQTNANTANQVEFVEGISEVLSRAVAINIVTAGTTARLMDAGIGVNATTVQSAVLRGGQARSNVINQINSSYSGYTGLGYDFLSWNERGLAGTLYYGDNGTDDRIRPGMMVWVEG